MQLLRQLRLVEPMNGEAQGIRVAFATTDMKTVNQHFGSAQAFAIYAVSPERAQLVEAAQFGQLRQDGNEDKLAVKLAAIDGCAIVYSQAIGSSAVRQLLSMNIQPVRVDAGSSIAELLAALQHEMQHTPPAWLSRAMAAHGQPDDDRFDRMESEGWQE